ncbi:hypothetical protein GCM10011608_56070 [Micromonospora sonchi]|uniref:Uncharacterized protein n=1 Tax=Micromonospora sonchi TaxID=1763543 RepID=A0A917U7P4_9ACTN|nr:hypothetical protein [Micromonospora sonchi]GGM63563.1 hypothetical protein GCM10011608_56070 [Micromonospora sonchi]
MPVGGIPVWIESGALYVGGVETLARKIARIVHANHLSRFDLK